ncbi:hypothetical protein IFT98_02955 [Pseudomonas sp. CFBP 8770]|uniref:hypothetical protein n=1 Tax=unclassified Pseudomonas TaxID=196821 RepID=UPI001783F11C|nr:MULTISPECIES: hypothetical protein [unclassified Pseudomonas]MBD8472957.1 hypothetical protein [Pseudomonas sp. CFBP 8773]MBD8645940.1 hypothetical protein [Pseudomonas sp. CFBP 8770]
MTGAERLQALLRLRELRERKARMAAARQARSRDELEQRIDNLTQSHCLHSEALARRDARNGAALLGEIVDHWQVQRYQQQASERVHLDRQFAQQLQALGEERSQVHARLETLTQQRRQHQRQCDAMAQLLAQEVRGVRLRAHEHAEAEAEDRPGGLPHG